MTDFIDTEGGLINLRFVRRISEHVSKDDKRRRYEMAHTDDGESYRMLRGALLPRGTVVPTPQAMTLVEIYVDRDEPPDVLRYPIVAWRIEDAHGFPVPIAVGCDEGRPGYQFIELPDGKLCQVGVDAALYDTLEACIAGLIKERDRAREARASREAAEAETAGC